MRDEFELLEKISRRLRQTAGTVGKKTDQFVELQKIRSRQHALEDSVEDTYMEIGKKIYARFVADENFDEEIETLCEVIARLQEEVELCKEEISAKKGEVECPNCGATVPKTALFCMNCGNAMEQKEDEEDDACSEQEEADN